LGELAADSDWISFEATVSTSPDQVAIAPGYLQREWTENDRRYFHSTMDNPTLNFYAFLSARYEVKRDRWNDVAIEVLHHPGHTYNVELRAVTPEHLQYLIHDFFERITLYESRALTATYTEVAGGKYEVKVTAKVRKLEGTGVGTEFAVKLADWMDVGVLDEEGKPLYLERVQVKQGDVTFTALVDQRPAKAGVDPLHKLIDRKPDDNTVVVEKL